MGRPQEGSGKVAADGLGLLWLECIGQGSLARQLSKSGKTGKTTGRKGRKC